MFRRFDRENDGFISVEEFVIGIEKIFEKKGRHVMDLDDEDLVDAVF